MTQGFPFAVTPTGWYQVAWADECSPGDVRPLCYFGMDLVLYRTEGGILRVFDAICPHLGANLGYGGRVEQECIRCPYHGWLWNTDGKNTEIPYERRPNQAQALVKWPVVEVNGLVFVWYSAIGEEPTWCPPQIPELGSGDFSSPVALRHMHARVRLHPQFIWENQVDTAHQQWVHKSSQPTDMYEYSDEGPVFHTKARILMGGDRGKTWATPDGPYWAEIRTWTYGMGFAMARFVEQDESIHVQSVTPLENGCCDLRTTVIVRNTDVDENGEPNELARRRFSLQVKQTDRDILIWSHQRYQQRAPFTPTEVKPFNAFRRWSAQFYPEVAGASTAAAGVSAY